MTGRDADRPAFGPQFHYPETRRARLIFAGHWTFIAIADLASLLLFPELNALSGQSLTPLRPFLIPLLFLSLLLAAWYFYTAQTHYLQTNPAGLYYRKGSYAVGTEWDNIDRIERLPGKAGESYEALILRRPGDVSKGRSLRSRPANAIPLTQFPDWRTGELGSELRRYRPAVLDPGNRIERNDEAAQRG